MLPVDADGEVVAEGDIVGQYSCCLDAAGELLEAPGCRSTTRSRPTTTPPPPPATLPRDASASAKDRLGGAGVYPGAGGILMSRLHRPGVLVAIDVTASRHPLAAVNPGWRATTR